MSNLADILTNDNGENSMEAPKRVNEELEIDVDEKDRGKYSNYLEILFILGSPYWTQPLRYPGAKNDSIDAYKVPGTAKTKLKTYKCAIPFAALCLAHADLTIPRLPVERSTKTGFMESEIEYITVKKGQEFVMTYLELMLLGMQPEYSFTFRYDGVDNGIRISTKEDNFKRKQPQYGPQGKRLPTPSLLSATGVSAKRKMQMICWRDPETNLPVWDDTPRGRLYKERFEYMYKGHVTRSTGRNKASAAKQVPVAAKRAMNCRAFLEQYGIKLDTDKLNTVVAPTDEE